MSVLGELPTRVRATPVVCRGASRWHRREPDARSSAVGHAWASSGAGAKCATPKRRCGPPSGDGVALPTPRPPRGPPPRGTPGRPSAAGVQGAAALPSRPRLAGSYPPVAGAGRLVAPPPLRRPPLATHGGRAARGGDGGGAAATRVPPIGPRTRRAGRRGGAAARPPGRRAPSLPVVTGRERAGRRRGRRASRRCCRRGRPPPGTAACPACGPLW